MEAKREDLESHHQAEGILVADKLASLSRTCMMQSDAAQSTTICGGYFKHEADARYAAIQLYNQQGREGPSAVIQPPSPKVRPQEPASSSSC